MRFGLSQAIALAAAELKQHGGEDSRVYESPGYLDEWGVQQEARALGRTPREVSPQELHTQQVELLDYLEQ